VTRWKRAFRLNFQSWGCPTGGRRKGRKIRQSEKVARNAHRRTKWVQISPKYAMVCEVSGKEGGEIEREGVN